VTGEPGEVAKVVQQPRCAKYHDSIRTLRRLEVLERPGDHVGDFTFDFLRDGPRIEKKT
jgi:hypothetical protein